MNDKLNGLISREDFDGFDSNQRDWLMFNYLQKIDGRVEKLEKRKRFDTGASVLSGFAGGVSAVAAKFIFWR